MNPMNQKKPLVLITGGAGFIGVNAAAYYISRGWAVSIFDNFARRGTKDNAGWLKKCGPVQITQGDIRNLAAVGRWVGQKNAGLILHLAAQVAVTSSVAQPLDDFEINALGTVNLLESLRKLKRPPLLIYASTNKVYGGMEEITVGRRGDRYEFSHRPDGISEDSPLDFHSPYGCSKGSADQYVRDYQRIYGLPTVVFRQSCIYGPHQHGNEDQGWVAHFMKAALQGSPLTLYGDGRQIRDILFVDDLIAAFDRARLCSRRVAGEIYNIGGGPDRTLSLRELMSWIESRTGRRLVVRKHGWRPGDQKVYVSDIRKAKRELGWAPKTSVRDGLENLWNWLRIQTRSK